MLKYLLALLSRGKLALSVGRRILTSPCEDSLSTISLVAKTLSLNYRFTWNQLDWWHDAEFNEFLTRFDEIDGFNTNRHWTLHQLLRLTDGLSGDTAECGVWRGASSYLIASANLRQGRNAVHHGFDSFVGLSEPGESDGNHWSLGDLAVPPAIAQNNLAAFRHAVRLYEGWIPTRFDEVSNLCFRFVHIDVDLCQPTADSLMFFYQRLVPGGIIVCDDYGFSTCPGVTASIDSFLADKPEKMIVNSTGGGFFMKGVFTGASSMNSPKIDTGVE